LIDRFNVVVELLHLDIDAVFVGPFFHDAGLGGISPGHPADIDRPRDLEVLLFFGLGRSEGERGDGGGAKQA
jgi:hypothetical protein